MNKQGIVSYSWGFYFFENKIHEFLVVIQVWGYMVFDFNLNCGQVNRQEQFLQLGILFFSSDDIGIHNFLRYC